MKQRKFRRAAAAVAAAAMLVTSIPAMGGSVLTAVAAGNLISNSTFDSSAYDWGTYKESGGACSLGTENGKLALKVSNVGTKNYSVQVFYDIVPLYQNGVYRLKYDISSSVPRYIEGMIQQNGGTYQAYTWKGLELTTTPQTVNYEFTMEQETDIMAKLVFNCGIQEKHEGALPEHTIYIDNVSLELVDDSKVDYSASRPYEPDIILNQVGYTPDSSKIAVFKETKTAGINNFSVVNASTNQTVFTGDLSASSYDSTSGEFLRKGDFSSVKTPGKYYITCGNADKSYEFTIGEDVYSNLIDDSVKMLYLQRCGVQVNDAVFGHKACHTSMAKVYGTNEKIDVSGGWHDAGDYGRYVVPAAKAVADLLYAYERTPEIFGDDLGIPESGNGTPDILDEARFELEWMLKMQSSNGGVYHKVSCATFPAYVMPEAETDELIVTPVSSTATADFCASMALAYEFYKDVDATFANKCLDAAKKAWSWLEQNPNFVFKNPEDIVTGEYGDKSDKDERYWAAAQMYRATGDSKYISNSIYTGLDWATVGDYGNIALLTMKNADKSLDAYKAAVSSIQTRANSFVSASAKSPYGVAISKFDWGSNMTIANAGIILGLAYDLTGEQKYRDAAQEQFNYLLGKNAVATCFMSGYGTVSPQNPHHRPSMAKGQAMKGMLAGGVNSNLEDSAAKAYCRDLPAAKCYIDNSESYSTNEITIYWNSPLTYLAALNASDISGSQGGEETDVVFGDANCDGTADISDAVLIMQWLANPEKYPISKQGLINADVCERGDGVTGLDALSIQKYEAKSLTKLPESYQGSSPVTQTTTTTSPIYNPTTTTTTTTVSGNVVVGCSAATLHKPDKTEYNVGETVDYTGSWFYFMVYAHMDGMDADGGIPQKKLTDYTSDIITEKYDFPILNTGEVRTFTGTVDRSKVDTSKPGTYTVTLKVTDDKGNVCGTGSFDIVVKGTSQPSENNGIKDYGTAMNSNATAVADFRKGSTPLFFASDGWSNESVFNCFWHKENTSLANNMLSLTIDKQRSDSKYEQSKNFPYSAAEYRTADFYHYGYYETSMQAIKNDGVVSSFFTYTGPTDIVNGQKNPWDEIDIEILGKDTTKVQFNYYTNSKGDHEYMYDLGFDASEGFHTYGFDWQPDHITWYVDGKAVYTAYDNIPSTPGKIMMNVWPGITVDDWLKPFDGKTPLTARYQWVTYNKQ